MEKVKFMLRPRPLSRFKEPVICIDHNPGEVPDMFVDEIAEISEKTMLHFLKSVKKRSHKSQYKKIKKRVGAIYRGFYNGPKTWFDGATGCRYEISKDGVAVFTPIGANNFYKK